MGGWLATAVLFALPATIAAPQGEPIPTAEQRLPGWTWELVDAVHCRWTNADLEQRAIITFFCKQNTIRIDVHHTLLDMADPDDGGIKVDLVSDRPVKRLRLDGKLARNQHGVVFDRDGRSGFVSWIRDEKNAGADLTVILSNGDRRGVYHFRNVNLTSAKELLSRDAAPKD